INIYTLTTRSPPRSTLFPYTTLFRSTVLGAQLTYELSKKGGKETLEKKLPRKQAKKIEKKFSQYGFTAVFVPCLLPPPLPAVPLDRKSTRLNSSHGSISYAVFCLKKK